MNDVRHIKFSVVIPAWNAAQTIVRAVRSCVEQSYPPHEIIVVDDAGTDGTEALIKNNFPQVTYIKLAENAGPAHARNTGWAMATGDFIAFQDADDVWHKDKLKLVAHALLHNEHIRFLYHPYTLAPMDFEADAASVTTARLPFSKLLWSNPIGTPCTVLVNDPALRFDEEMRYMEDYDLWLKAGHRFGIYRLNLALTQINRPILSAGGQSSNRRKMRSGEFRAYVKMAKRHPQYWLLIPLLIGFGALKHVIKSFGPPRSNY
jgi:glycosyltransferase involved in cell wall biosynthesis